MIVTIARAAPAQVSFRSLGGEIINYDKTRQQIAEAQNVEEVLTIRDQMDALIKAFKRDPEMERRARELKLLAEARLGEMSLTLKSEQGTRNDFAAQGGKVDGKLKTLKSAGIKQQDASMYERLAEARIGEMSLTLKKASADRGNQYSASPPSGEKQTGKGETQKSAGISWRRREMRG